MMAAPTMLLSLSNGFLGLLSSLLRGMGGNSQSQLSIRCRDFLIEKTLPYGRSLQHGPGVHDGVGRGCKRGGMPP